MRIVRYLDRRQEFAFGSLQRNGDVDELKGCFGSGFTPVGKKADVRKLLSPIVPTAILGVGLNYRRHAAESGAKIPEFPVLFAKGVNTVQNPHDPILLPRTLRSNEVDYECELAVVIGKACKNVKRANALEYVLGYT